MKDKIPVRTKKYVKCFFPFSPPPTDSTLQVYIQEKKQTSLGRARLQSYILKMGCPEEIS